MRKFRGPAAFVLLASCIAVGSVGQASAAAMSPFARVHRHHSHHHHGINRHGAGHVSWNQHDRAVYAVSTLNAPLCPNHQQLSTVLANSAGAKLFDVLRATIPGGIYFIQVRTSDASLIGVYEYRFGTKLPTGIQNARCVAPASAGTVSAYQSHDWKFVARFGSTYPQS